MYVVDLGDAMKNLIAVFALVGLLAACGSSTEPTGESVVVTGAVTLDGAPVAAGSVELFPADIATVQTIEIGGPITLGSASIEAGGYRVSAEVSNPVFCASLTISVSVEGASGALFDTRRLGRCGEHVGVDFAF